MGCAPQAKNVQQFVFVILYFLSQLGKNMHTFYHSGKKYEFSPLFCLLSIILFPSTCYFAMVKQKNIHPCVNI